MLQDKITVVTGAGSGIGRSLAIRFAEKVREPSCAPT